MSLDEALYELVGAGLVACAAGLGLAVPKDAVASGDGFIGMLSQRGEWGEAARIVAEVRRDVEEERHTTGLVAARMPGQLRLLVRLLELARPDPGLLRAALHAPARSDTGKLNGIRSLPHEIAARVDQRAGEVAGLDRELAERILHRLMQRLLAAPAFIVGLEPALRDYLASISGGPAEDGASVRNASPIEAQRPARAAGPAIGDPAGQTSEEPALIEALAAEGRLPDVLAVKQRHRLTDGAFDRLLQHLDAQACPPADAAMRLEEMASWLGALIETLTKPSNEDPQTRRIKAEAAAALAAGHFEQAMQRLKSARRLIREGRRRIEERLREGVLELNAQMVAEAQAIARLAEMELAQRNYASAAELYAEAQDSLPQNDRQSAWLYTMRQAEALFRQGDEFADQAALIDSVEAYEAALAMSPREAAAKNWAAAQCGIGLAHFRFGEREAGSDNLQRAAAAWREALGALAGLDEPAQTALTQRHLAQALALIGEREPASPALAEAAQAYRAALAGLSRESAPSEWLSAQTGLGTTLLTLDERAQGSADTAGLSEALAAFGNALGALSRDKQPRDWAMAQMNMGSVLLALGEKEGRVARFGEAVLAYQESLQVFTRSGHAPEWALAKMNLANALAAIGEAQGDAARLADAAAAYRDALQVLDREREPINWAITQMNLATVLARRTDTPDRAAELRAALAAMMAAHDVFEARQATEFAEIARRNLVVLHKSARDAHAARAGQA
jgi:tetratricopeptide (TPR) repeat protein